MDRKAWLALAAIGGGAASLKVVTEDGKARVITRSPPVVIAQAVSRIPVPQRKPVAVVTYKPIAIANPIKPNEVPPPMTPGPVKPVPGTTNPPPKGQETMPTTSPGFNGSPRIKYEGQLYSPVSQGNWQAITRNRRTGEWFMAHSKSVPPYEDIFIYRFNASMKYLDYMKIPRGGHVLSFSVSDDNVIWITYGASSTDMGRGRLVTVDYVAGASMGSKRLRDMGDGQISISPGREWCVICTSWANGGYQFKQYKKADVVNGKLRQYGKTIKVRKAGQPIQGFALADGCLFLLFGRDNQSARIEKWWIKSGKKLGTVNITNVGYKSGEKHDQREPEGMDGRYFAVKVHGGKSRRMRIYSHNI